MLLVITCWVHVEITVWMYTKCDWWIHWEKNDPEPTIYPRCSHWFPGHLAPSEMSSLNRVKTCVFSFFSSSKLRSKVSRYRIVVSHVTTHGYRLILPDLPRSWHEPITGQPLWLRGTQWVLIDEGDDLRLSSRRSPSHWGQRGSYLAGTLRVFLRVFKQSTHTLPSR